MCHHRTALRQQCPRSITAISPKSGLSLERPEVLSLWSLPYQIPIKYRPLASPSSLLVRLLAQDEIVDSQDDRGGRETQCRRAILAAHVADVTLARAAIARPSPLAVRYRDSNKRTCAQGSADLIRATPRHGSKIPLKGLALATS